MSENNIFTLKQTGKLMLKFDDDEPIEMGQIHGFGEVSFTLKQSEFEDFQASIVFTDEKTGKKLRIFIEKI
jgi:hypothetical protein